MPADETRVFFTLLAVLGLVTIFLIFFIATIISYQKKYLRLYMQRLAAEIETLEKERRSISSNLHDDIGPVLSIIKLQISSRLEDGIDTLLGEAIQNLDYVIQHIRQLNEALFPFVLLRKGLGAALQTIAEQVNQSGELYVQLKLDCDTSFFSEQFSVQLFRIIQELLNNTLKYASAKRFEVAIIHAGQYLHLHVKDDGKGFDLHKVMQYGVGLGLRNIFSRTELLGGQLQIDTTPGQGVHYQLKIPFTYGQEKYTYFTGR